MYSTSLIAFLEWLQKQPERLRLHLVQLVAELMPGCNVTVHSDNVCEQFNLWLHNLSPCPAKAIGAILAIKSIVNFCVMDNIRDLNQWKEQTKNIDALIKKMRSDGNCESRILRLQQHRETLQFHCAQAVEMKASWINLCEIHFTNDAIRSQLK